MVCVLFSFLVSLKAENYVKIWLWAITEVETIYFLKFVTRHLKIVVSCSQKFCEFYSLKNADNVNTTRKG